MAFVRVRKIKGRHYRYREERWREGGKVRSRSTCLGAVDGDEPQGFLRRLFPPTHGIDWAEIELQELARMKIEDARRAAVLEGLHQAYGLKLGPAVPVPVEKIAVSVELDSQENQSVQENAPPEGEADDQ